ncbi:MAG: ABC transporter substrate-binding protein [Halomonas sp.]|jgi:glucose/mannose transport system substrate-binding protein|uniref:Probable sugar-binding periplasmic protein n=1 Tax=Billgrantia tianxiuensis TaxID=2497861 RepID=A0A6I6SM03_9GAMM|nr:MULTISPECIES: ABC transporter substrate-binding protein [Halomonas]MCE8032647.1 carbohydrate ABC transporter substrate-binding protein [Halomonas sp. MCCC 1A11057]MDX5434845.1 ABC transporter substrate-binding protein [Halomonas sp.]QHC49434.1 carbohydrate ABC transporter substrate-binding protein [Halomonas tianxiuensis]
MKRLLKGLCLAAAVTFADVHGDDPAAGHTVDIVHYWTSRSEAAALDVYRQAWIGAGNRWVDLAAENEAALKRVVSDRIAHGYPPAVMQWNVAASSRELRDFGVVQDIEPVAREQGWHERLPNFVLERISHEGKVYFAPSNIHVENWLWTSQAIFDEVGLEVPESWEEILTAAERIEAAGYQPIAIGAEPWEIALLFHGIMYYAMGSDGYERVFNGEAEAVLDEEMLDALDLLRRISRYAPPPAAREGKSWADAAAAIGRGEAGMQFMGDWVKGELTLLGYRADRDFGCTFTPGTSIAYFMVLDAFAFPLTAREGETQAQQEFARMVFEPDNQIAFSRLKGALPTRLDVDPGELDSCGQRGLQELIKEKYRTEVHSRAMPSHQVAAWIGILAEFFDDESISSQSAQQRMYQVISEG